MTVHDEQIRWQRFPQARRSAEAKQRLEIQDMLGLAPNTIEAYGRGLEDFLGWCKRSKLKAVAASRADVAAYVGDLRKRPGPRGKGVVALESGSGLSNATMQQRLTAIRLFFDFLIEEGRRDTNPVGRGRYTAVKGFGGGKRERGLLPRRKRLPCIPLRGGVAPPTGTRSAGQRSQSLHAGARVRRCASPRGALPTRFVGHQPAHRLLRVRAETSKSRQDRVVPYSETTGVLLSAYLTHRRNLSRKRGPLFLSESHRNHAEPLSLWTWSKVVRRIADAAELPRFSTHTLRHMCLTDLACVGWDLHEIARFAGHRNVSVTEQYVHLSGRDLAKRLESGMAQIHEWRVRELAADHTPRDTR